MVVGVSGGIDSALTAALASKVAQQLNMPLIARSLTIESNKPDEIERSIMVGKAFATDFRHVDLTEAYHKIQPLIVEDFDKEDKNSMSFKIRMGNIKARLRMIYLYDLAAKNKGLVLSTDNYTELLLGFWTLHGDVGDIGMIQNLWKTEVYEMAKWLAQNEANEEQAKALWACINAVPTDGLGITNSDLDQLKAPSYSEVDKILQAYLAGDKSLENHPVIQRHLASAYKRNNPYNFPREIILGE
jgi:NAD+ synthetase